jgi:predicted phosphodiesterase
VKRIRKLFPGLLEISAAFPSVSLENHKKLVIFSDLHLGDGRARDDFLPNGQLFQNVLEQYYLKQSFSLVLNGDVEDLQKFSCLKIRKAWKVLYQLFARFHDTQQLFKIVGNHDQSLHSLPRKKWRLPLLPGLRLLWKDNEIVVFHGHQASGLYDVFQPLITLGLRFLAVPLGIMNGSASHSNAKKIKLEERVYAFSRLNQIVSIIGHTHRPLFESLSKRESVKYQLEAALRRLQQASGEEEGILLNNIAAYKDYLYNGDDRRHVSKLIYSTIVPVPCLFNSGCCVGKRGITCLEITDGTIALVHWSSREASPLPVSQMQAAKQDLPEINAYRTILHEDSLDYIFTCIKLLS